MFLCSTIPYMLGRTQRGNAQMTRFGRGLRAPPPSLDYKYEECAADKICSDTPTCVVGILRIGHDSRFLRFFGNMSFLVGRRSRPGNGITPLYTIESARLAARHTKSAHRHTPLNLQRLPYPAVSHASPLLHMPAFIGLLSCCRAML